MMMKILHDSDVPIENNEARIIVASIWNTIGFVEIEIYNENNSSPEWKFSFEDYFENTDILLGK